MKKILVTNASWVNNANPMNTLIRGLAADNILNYIREHPLYKERDTVEENPAFRQIIPYILIQNGDKFVLMRRMEGQGEKRLHGNHYIGVGGHVDFADYKFCPVEETAQKEIFEETGFKMPRSMEYVGVILKNETPVDKVHLGMLYHYITDERQFDTPEMHLHDLRWADIGQLRKHYSNMEGWSKIVMDSYILDDLGY